MAEAGEKYESGVSGERLSSELAQLKISSELSGSGTGRN